MPLLYYLYFFESKKRNTPKNMSLQLRIVVFNNNTSMDWVRKHQDAFESALHVLRQNENSELMQLVQKRISRIMIMDHKIALFFPFSNFLVLSKQDHVTDNYVYIAAAIAGLAAGISVVCGKVVYNRQSEIEAQKKIVKSVAGSEAFYAWAFDDTESEQNQGQPQGGNQREIRVNPQDES